MSCGSEVMPMKYIPHDYQNYITGKIIELPAAGIFADMGLG